MMSHIKVFTVDYMEKVMSKPDKALIDIGIIVDLLSKQTVKNQFTLYPQSPVYLGQINTAIQKCINADKAKLINETLTYMLYLKRKLESVAKNIEPISEPEFILESEIIEVEPEIVIPEPEVVENHTIKKTRSTKKVEIIEDNVK